MAGRQDLSIVLYAETKTHMSTTRKTFHLRPVQGISILGLALAIGVAGCDKGGPGQLGPRGAGEPGAGGELQPGTISTRAIHAIVIEPGVGAASSSGREFEFGQFFSRSQRPGL